MKKQDASFITIASLVAITAIKEGNTTQAISALNDITKYVSNPESTTSYFKDQAALRERLVATYNATDEENEENETKVQIAVAIEALEAGDIDHPSLALLADHTDPDTSLGELVDAELAKRGLTRVQV